MKPVEASGFRTSDKAHVRKSDPQPDQAKTGFGDNDTSVIRGPATRKAGRVIPYASDPANRRLMIPIGLKKSSLGVFGTNREKNMKYKGTGSDVGSPIPFYIKRRRNNNDLQ